MSSTGNHRRLGGQKTPQEAYALGYRFAIVAPKGNALSFHMNEKAAGSGLYSLRKSGCRMAPLESLIGGS